MGYEEKTADRAMDKKRITLCFLWLRKSSHATQGKRGYVYTITPWGIIFLRSVVEKIGEKKGHSS